MQEIVSDDVLRCVRCKQRKQVCKEFVEKYRNGETEFVGKPFKCANCR